MKDMRKVIVAAVIIGVFVLYSILHAQSGVSALTPTAPVGSRSNGPTAAPSANLGAGTPTVTTPAGARYKNGSYLGSVSDAQWGVIQVRAIITGGRITDVRFVQYPNERQRSLVINQYADPQLTSEAIQAQSANVDIVTGATDTSEAFIQSLSDALTQAQA